MNTEKVSKYNFFNFKRNKMKKYKKTITVDSLKNQITNFTKNKKYEEIVILGTGPSLEEGIEYLKNKNRDKLLIICLKQSFLKVNNLGFKLIHLLNPWNLQKYIYKNADVLKIYFHEYFAKFVPDIDDYDLYFYNENIKNPIQNSILAKKQFSKYLYTNEDTFSESRPVMPGIFGESLYLALLIGSKKINLFGVDYSYNTSNKKDHYYNLPLIFEKSLKLASKFKFFQFILFNFGLRTQYSIAYEEEMKIAIPGYSQFIKYIEEKHDVKVRGWKHSNY